MPQVRSVFVSDIHLGTRACQAERLIEFLREHPADHLYLLGDVIDFWAMARSIHWSAAQNTVVQKVLRRARHGEKVVLVAATTTRRCANTSASPSAIFSSPTR